MPFKDPAKMAEYMRAWRSAKSGRVNVNPTNRVNPYKPKKRLTGKNVNPSVNYAGYDGPHEKIYYDTQDNKIKRFKREPNGSWKFVGIIPEGSVYAGIIYTVDNAGSPAALKRLRDSQKVNMPTDQ